MKSQTFEINGITFTMESIFYETHQEVEHNIRCKMCFPNWCLFSHYKKEQEQEFQVIEAHLLYHSLIHMN